jgi:glycosyltransferase involved in cell wall biosynthesis
MAEEKYSPKISILTCVLNDRRGIEKTFNSIRSQLYLNFEYIIIDGGSTDGTIDVINKNKDIVDCLISEKDRGVYFAFNKAIKLSQGFYVKILNAGDTFFNSDSLNFMVSRLESNPEYDGIYGSIAITDSNYNIRKLGTRYSRIKYFESFNHPSWILKRSVYCNFGLYSTDYFVSSDYEYFLRLKCKNINLQYIASPPLVCFHPGITGKYLNGVKEVFKINMIYLGLAKSVFVFIQHLSFKVGAIIKRKLNII